MKKLLFFYILFNVSVCYAEDYIFVDKERWKTFHHDFTITEKVSAWYLPFKTADRKDLKSISVISTFGSARNSFRKGHYHTGLDLMPKKHKEPVDVYAMAEGVVVSVHLGDPHQTVVVKHKTKDGETIYSVYKHITDVKVRNGDKVSHETKIARVLTKAEGKKHGGNYDHLHLEIRKKFDDYGCASWLTMTKEDLSLRFYDPHKFMKENVTK
ncbi:MAG: M23 family metallopeptidase [Candidatus Kapabacteria bacterium]|nr:M23 family metallopeptidase [Ignavibacteriota bacterium]MCW5885743.1 M23 family metallopeptidase [Candidatus Kapabacteria bacterium]